LPSRSPELNPVENTWQHLRANWFSNRPFETCKEIGDGFCDAWSKLTALPADIKPNRNARLGPCRLFLNAALAL
jgi:hypothetical protein